MLIVFLNTLFKKPKGYQLFWIYILGQINDGEIIQLELKQLKKRFNVNKSTFYRMLHYGLEFFNNNSNGISIVLSNQNLVIQVIRKKKVMDNKNIVKCNNELHIKVIEYLNHKTNKKFTTKNKQTIRFINARIKDGYNEVDFKKVIDIKTEKWLNNSMEDYLRPQTLFSSKMEGYLNEKNNNKKSNERFKKTQSAIEHAKQIDWFSKG